MPQSLFHLLKKRTITHHQLAQQNAKRGSIIGVIEVVLIHLQNTQAKNIIADGLFDVLQNSQPKFYIRACRLSGVVSGLDEKDLIRNQGANLFGQA